MTTPRHTSAAKSSTPAAPMIIPPASVPTCNELSGESVGTSLLRAASVVPCAPRSGRMKRQGFQH